MHTPPRGPERLAPPDIHLRRREIEREAEAAALERARIARAAAAGGEVVVRAPIEAFGRRRLAHAGPFQAAIDFANANPQGYMLVLTDSPPGGEPDVAPLV